MKSDPLNKTQWLDKYGLSYRQRSFVLAYLKSKVGNAAARVAGYKQPESQAARMLAKGKVKAAVNEGLAEIEAAAQVDAEKVLSAWWATAQADPSAFSRVERIACRYCHGHDHEYQWRTPREYRESLCIGAESISKGDEAIFRTAMAGGITDPRLPLDVGGYGYSAKARPHADCPECDGAGIETVFVADIRDLPPEAAILFDGAKINAKGKIEIVMLDRMKALDNVAKHLGMFDGRGERGKIVGTLAGAMVEMMQRAQTRHLKTLPDIPLHEISED
jgi:hypothetical protein